MSQAAVLCLLVRFPHPAALARCAGDGGVFAALRRLEQDGLVTRRRGLYRITTRGRRELALDRALRRAVDRALAA
jgi:DNA-binding PadR family transcriptional regulator